MRRWLLLLLLSGCQQQPAPPVTPTAMAPVGTVVAMGDSLTEGLGVELDQAYPAQLQKRLQQDGYLWKVVNAGVSGETSSGARSRLDYLLQQLKPDLLILETGANDGLRGIDPALTEKNLREMITRLHAQRVEVLLAGMRVLRNSGPDYEHKFNALYPRLAADLKVELIPFFLEGVAGKRELNQDDAIHPTPQGYSLIVNRLAPQLERMLARIRTSR